MMRNRRSLTALIPVALLATGCLQKETSHTLCLSPDGQVAWIASESTVYSDTAEPAGRRAEEQAYLAAALAGEHAIGLALEALAPSGEVRTTVLRREAPFFVMTEATFPSVESLLQRLLEDAPAVVTARSARDGGRSTLTIDLDFSADVPERESPVRAILDDVDDLRIVMTEGRFVSGAGFDIANGTAARLSRDWIEQAEKALQAKGRIQMTLTWEKPPV